MAPTDAIASEIGRIYCHQVKWSVRTKGRRFPLPVLGRGSHQVDCHFFCQGLLTRSLCLLFDVQVPSCLTIWQTSQLRMTLRTSAFMPDNSQVACRRLVVWFTLEWVSVCICHILFCQVLAGDHTTHHLGLLREATKHIITPSFLIRMELICM